MGELDPISATSAIFIRLLPGCKCKYHLNTHEKSVTNVMEKVMEKSWNVMEFGFENCVGTLACLTFSAARYGLLQTT